MRWATTAGRAGGIWVTTFSSSAMAQQLGRGAEIDLPLWRILAGLGLILALGVGALLVVRSRGAKLTLWRPVAHRRLKVIETTRLSPQGVLCLASCDGTEYLIAITPGSALVVDRPSLESDTR
jgi:hypothetical protein